MSENKLTTEEITKIAHLARLQLTDQERQQAAGHLSDILGHFAKIQDIDTEGVPTADDASGLKNITRPDQANSVALCDPADVLAAVPRQRNNQVQVPAVF